MVNKLVIGTEINTKGAEDGIMSLTEFIEKAEANIGRKLTDDERKMAEKMYHDIREKVWGITSTFERMTQDTGKGIKGLIKNVTRWGLAIFGIRGAFMMVRNAMSTISSQDAQLKADIDYMRNAIAYTLEPLIRRIVAWAKQLLFYIGYIIKMWTGKNIFENANKSLQNADRSAKSLQKTLAGFDEMNILNDNGTVGVGGAMPSFDLSALEGVQIPDWIYWIAKNKDVVLGFVQALIAQLVYLKYGLEGIMFLGIGIAIVSVVNLIKDLITYIKDPTWENFRAVLGDLANAITGVGLAMIGFNATNPAGWIVLAIGLIGDFIIKLNEERDATNQLTDAKDNLNRAEQNYINAHDAYLNATKNKEEALKNLIAVENETRESGEELYNSVLYGTQKYEDLTTAQKKTFDAYSKYKSSILNLEDATTKLKDKEHEQILAMLELKAKTSIVNNDFNDLGKTINELVKNGKISVKEAKKVLEDTYKSMGRAGKETFKEQLPSYIDKTTQSTKDLLRELTKIENQYDAIYRAGSRAHSATSSVRKAKGGIAYAKGGIVPTIKLASGAIINRPGPGVPIGGERAPEGVIPLTDSQQMELLGSAIGKYITINATIPVYAYNRQVDRQAIRIRAEDNFAGNR